MTTTSEKWRVPKDGEYVSLYFGEREVLTDIKDPDGLEEIELIKIADSLNMLNEVKAFFNNQLEHDKTCGIYDYFKKCDCWLEEHKALLDRMEELDVR